MPEDPHRVVEPGEGEQRTEDKSSEAGVPDEIVIPFRLDDSGQEPEFDEKGFSRGAVGYGLYDEQFRATLRGMEDSVEHLSRMKSFLGSARIEGDVPMQAQALLADIDRLSLRELENLSYLLEDVFAFGISTRFGVETVGGQYLEKAQPELVRAVQGLRSIDIIFLHPYVKDRIEKKKASGLRGMVGRFRARLRGTSKA